MTLLGKFRGRGVAKCRRIVRGFHRLKASEDPAAVARLIEELTALDLSLARGDVSPLVFQRAAASEVENAARQFLLMTCADIRLTGAILDGLSGDARSIAAAVPKAWVDQMRRSGFRVSRVRSGILFAAFVARRFRVGFAQIASILRASSHPEKQGIPVPPHALFTDLHPNNLPRKSGRESHDVVSWYLKWNGRAPGIAEIRHTVTTRPETFVGGVVLRPVPSVIPPLDGIVQKARFALWSAAAVIAALWHAVRGRWVTPLLLSEAAKARQVAQTPAHMLAREYLFSLSSVIYRPLWTYTAERKGSVVTMFNYSASFQDFKTALGLPRLQIGFSSMTWQRVLLWSPHYAEFCRSLAKGVQDVMLVPPIWFSDSDEEVPWSDRPCVAVFDITPVRPGFRPLLVPELEYRTYEVCRDFLDDIYSVLRSAGVEMMWKRKRDFGPIHDKRYARFSADFVRRPGVLDVPSGISAFRVVEKAVAVVSAPFTSTGLIGTSMNLPSVYFDPTGVLHADDRAAQEIRLVSSRRELADWLAQALPVPQAARA